MSADKTLTGLQFLRGICALAVVIDHTASMASSPKYFDRPFLGGALENGKFGVDIFFVISAFIISIVVLRRNEPSTNGKGVLWLSVMPTMSTSTFFIKRFVRIVPLMWIAILSYAALQFAFARSDIDTPAYLRAIFLIPYSFVKPDMIWTLRHEFLFYVAFACSFIGTKGLRLVLPAFILSPIAYSFFWNGELVPASGIYTPAATVFSAVNLEFGAGVILGFIWVRNSPRVSLHMPLHPLWTLTLLTALFIALATALPWLPRSIPSTAVMGVLGAALVSLSARAVCPAGLVTSLGKVLGDSSYAIYLFHLHALAGTLAIWAKLLPNSPLGIVVPVMVFVATSMGVAVHFFIERSLVGWSRRRLFAPFAPAR